MQSSAKSKKKREKSLGIIDAEKLLRVRRKEKKSSGNKHANQLPRVRRVEETRLQSSCLE